MSKLIRFMLVAIAGITIFGVVLVPIAWYIIATGSVLGAIVLVFFACMCWLFVKMCDEATRNDGK